MLSTGDVVRSTKTVTKTISRGKVEITATDLGTDKASDWTVIEVFYANEKMLADIASSAEKITLVLDDADSSSTGDVVVTLTYDGALNVTEDVQPPPSVAAGQVLFGSNSGTQLLFDAATEKDGSYRFYNSKRMTSFEGDMPAMTTATNMF